MKTISILSWLCVVGLMVGGCSSDRGRVVDSEPKITGTVNYRVRIALPPTAVLTVRLLDVTEKGAPAIVLAEKSISNPGNPPMRFELSYPFGGINEHRRYVIDARIEVNGRLKFYSMQQHAVTHANAGQPHEIWVEQAKD